MKLQESWKMPIWGQLSCKNVSDKAVMTRDEDERDGLKGSMSETWRSDKKKDSEIIKPAFQLEKTVCMEY